MLRKIPCDWFLTDGILSDIRLGAPLTVMEALLRAGVIKDDGKLVSRLSREWVFRRVWRYYTRFDAPSYEGARAFLVMDGLFGEYRAYLNDALICEGQGEYMKAEATSHLKKENNLLEIEFEPEDHTAMLSSAGLSGALFLCDSGEIAIVRADAHFTTDMCTMVSAIDARDDGEAQLIYTLETETEKREKTIYKTLKKGLNEVEDSPFTKIGAGRATLELCVKRDALTSDTIRFTKYVQADQAMARGLQTSDGFGMAITRRVNGNAVLTNGSPRAYVLAADRGLTAYTQGRIAVQAAEIAVQQEDLLLELAGGDTRAIEKEALWRLSGIRTDVFAPVIKAYGGDAPLSVKIAVSRYLQAIRLRELAEDARINSEGLILAAARDRMPTFASRSLFDKNDRPRPAYFALMQAWKPAHAFARAPKGCVQDGIMTVPIYFLSDDPTLSATVNACAYTPDGHELIEANFPVLGGAADAVGRLLVEADENTPVIVRTKVIIGGACADICESLFLPEDAALGSVQQTQLIFRNGAVENVGATAAVGVSVPGADAFRVLLPGETIAIAAGKPTVFESLNGIE